MGTIDDHDISGYSQGAGLLGSVRPQDLVYFALAVGNGDTQLLLLPEDANGVRHMIVVDVATVNKLPDLIETLSIGTGVDAQPALLKAESRIKLLVATHPHEDHVAGIPNLLDRCGHLLAGGEVWDPAYFSSNLRWQGMMNWLESHPEVGRLHPTSGTTRFIGDVVITALSPAISLRSMFDTYGVFVNNASIALRVEFPAARVFTGAGTVAVPPGVGRVDRGLPDATKLILGADSQTLSWGHIEADFPVLESTDSEVQKQLAYAVGREPLSATLLKVPHHASKKGLNYELAERIKPSVSIVTCSPAGNSHGFPHIIAQEQLREALDPVAKNGKAHKPDHDLNIHYTGGAVDHAGAVSPLGSIAVVLSPTKRWTLWRLRDKPSEKIGTQTLMDAWRWG